MDKPATRSGSAGTYSVKEFFQQKIGRTMADASADARVSYSSLQSHVSRDVPLSAESLRRLAEWDDRISVAKTLGVKS